MSFRLASLLLLLGSGAAVPAGDYYIQFVNQKSYGAESGWWLGAQRYYSEDERNANSTFASIHEGNAGWERATWKLISAGPNEYYIKFVNQRGYGAADMHGWWLGAQRYYPKDKRNQGSTFASIQEGKDRATWERATWKLIRAGPNEYYIKFVNQRGYGAADMHGWWLGAQRFYPKDKRNQDSTFASLEEGNEGWERATWKLVVAEDTGFDFTNLLGNQPKGTSSMLASFLAVLVGAALVGVGVAIKKAQIKSDEMAEPLLVA